MSYRDLDRKTITLPSGATVTIRKLNPRDYVSVGNIPTIYPDPKGPKPKASGKSADDEAWAVKVEKFILTQAISPIEFQGEKVRVVDKPFGTASDGEVEIETLHYPDREAIIAEVVAFTGMGKEAGQTAQNFQPDRNGHAPVTPNGEGLRTEAVGDPAGVV